MNSLLRNHLDVQTGMYFSQHFEKNGWDFLVSDIIEDGFWNYAILPERSDALLLLPAVETEFRNMNRSSSIYIINEDTRKDEITTLSECGYEKMAEESFMTYSGNVRILDLPNDIRIVRAIKDNAKNDFIDVFTNAYGGEKTPEQPYGDLDDTYMNALLRSFNDIEKFYHYVCYAGDKPVSIATLCFANGIGGIYNVGTIPNDRGNGYGTYVTKECISAWKHLNGSTLLLQTETGSVVEKWYYSLGFKLEFHGSTYCKEL